MRRREEIALWPVYFDSNRARAEGRRVPKMLGKSSPTLGMITKALDNLGFSYRVVSGAAYPRHPWRKTGLVLVKKEKSKPEILKMVAKELSRLHV